MALGSWAAISPSDLPRDKSADSIAETLVKLAEALDTTVDYLLTGTQIEESNLANIRLFRRFQALEHLGQDDQQTIIRLIDAFVAQHRIAAVMAPVD